MAADAGVTGDVMVVGSNGAGGLLLELALVALGKGVPAKLVAVIGELELVGVAWTPKPDHNGMRACGGERYEVSVCVMTREPNVKRGFRIEKRL